MRSAVSRIAGYLGFFAFWECSVAVGDEGWRAWMVSGSGRWWVRSQVLYFASVEVVVVAGTRLKMQSRDVGTVRELEHAPRHTTGI